VSKIIKLNYWHGPTSNCGPAGGEWASCWEWCLSKPSTCVHLLVSVRRNGSAVTWRGCTAVTDTVCPVADRELVEAMPCTKDLDCLPLNQRFGRKCGLYGFCEAPAGRPVFVCKQKQCVSRRETRWAGQCLSVETGSRWAPLAAPLP
jgi:hypothetical protein